MSDINTVILSGRLTRNPELRKTPSGTAVCDLSVASNRWWKGQQFTTFARCTCWDRTAEIMGDTEKGLRTGDYVQVQGRLVHDDFELTKGDPATKTSGRMKVDNCSVNILLRRQNDEAPSEAPEAEQPVSDDGE